MCAKVWVRKKTFRDMNDIFNIYECKWVCAIRREKITKLAFQRETRSIRPGEEKQIQARKIYQYKSVKALAIAW